MESQDKYVIIVAGGSGTRMGTEVPKQFLPLHSKPIIVYSIEKFTHAVQDIKVIVVLPKHSLAQWDEIKNKYLPSLNIKTIVGGETRFHSVKNGLKEIEGKAGIVAVHDAVRPLVDEQVIQNAFKEAETSGAAIPVVEIVDSIRRVENGAHHFEDRSKYRIVQTPQCFKVEILKKSYLQEYSSNFTDDATVVESTGRKVALVEGNKENIKITHPADIKVAEALMTPSSVV